MKIIIKLHFGNKFKLDNIIYADPSEEKIEEVCRQIFKSLELLKIK